MKRSFLLLLSMLFTALAFTGQTEGRESPYYRGPISVENGVENEDHPWGGDGTGTNGSSEGKGGRRVMVSSSIGTYRFDMWLSQLAYRFIIAPKTPIVSPRPSNVPSPTQNNTSAKNGGAN